MQKTKWISLPCEGALLKRIQFFGSGKRGRVTLETDHPLTVRLNTHALSLVAAEGVKQTLKRYDDVRMTFTIEPHKGALPRLYEARIDFLWLEQDMGEQPDAYLREHTNLEAGLCDLSASFDLRLHIR
ncbi:MAG: hypothetical protein AAFV53_21895 [Myxococcota bacterium]